MCRMCIVLRKVLSLIYEKFYFGDRVPLTCCLALGVQCAWYVGWPRCQKPGLNSASIQKAMLLSHYPCKTKDKVSNFLDTLHYTIVATQLHQ